VAEVERVYGYSVRCDCVVVSSESAAVEIGCVSSLSYPPIPTDDDIPEKRIALPLGIIFWVLSILCLLSGLANYIHTVTRYSKREAMVQTGWKTQIVFTVVSTSIVAACVLFLSTNPQKE
jgi:heme/copper-type cytochrome/quinol oxidase subunit 2